MPIWMTCSTRKISGLARRFMASRDGAVAIYMGFTTAVFIGFSALWLDLGRVYTMQSELQSAADAAALAGAAELMGNVGAIARATTAAQGAVATSTTPLTANAQTFDTAGTGVTIASVRILKSLPTDDQPIITGTHTTNIDQEARFIEVTTQLGTSQNFMIPVLGGPFTSQTEAVAVAGYNRVVCRIPPIAFCNPEEDPSKGGMGADFPLANYLGTQVRVKELGANASWQPGFFGLLDTPSGSQSTVDLANMIAAVDPDSGCYSSNVDVKPGQVESLHTAFNTRFDMFEPPHFKNKSTDPNYATAKNVVKGKLLDAGKCNLLDPDPSVTPPTAQKLPRDGLLDSNPNAKFGDGNWDRLGYWKVNHSQSIATWPPSGSGLAANASRWDVYLWEINNNRIPGSPGWSSHQATLASGDKASTQEVGVPDCAATNFTNNPDRRTIIVAVINCIEHNVQGNQPPDIPVKKYIKMFMTEPMPKPGSPSDPGELVLEFAAEVGALDDVVHDIVQLYR